MTERKYEAEVVRDKEEHDKSSGWCVSNLEVWAAGGCRLRCCANVYLGSAAVIFS